LGEEGVMKKRQSFDKAFKAKVVLEALKEAMTIKEIANKYSVHPNQITLWKKQAIENLPDIFERPNKKSEQEKKAEEKYEDALKTVGMMKIENEYLKKVQAPVRERARLIEKENPRIRIGKQCEVLGISRSMAYYEPQNEVLKRDLVLLEKIREILAEIPFYGYRKVMLEVRRRYFRVTEKQVRRVMARSGLQAIFPGRNLSKARQEHKKYPYLLSGKAIRYPNQVWATDLSYIKLPSGHVYLMAIMDLFSRKVLNWTISNTLDAHVFANCLSTTIEEYGAPAIFNTDQGCQFTSDCWISVLKNHGVQVSMDGRNRALDNVFVERLWRSLKYEDIYIRHYESVIELRKGFTRYFRFYNSYRSHQHLDYQVPDEMYESFQIVDQERTAA